MQHLYLHFRTYGLKHKPLYIVSLMIFFWALFDGIIAYIVPIAITQEGFSKTTMGFIIGSSSVSGAIFDFLLSKYLPNTHFRRIYFLFFISCLLMSIILWQASSIWIYLLAMSFWGLYYDLRAFGDFDFVSRETSADEHSSSFGVMDVFKSLGLFIAFLLAGLIIGDTIDFKPFLIATLFLSLGFIFYLILVSLTKKESNFEEKIHKPVNPLVEIHLWEKIGVIIVIPLVLTMFLSVYDAFFLTIGPLLSEDGSGGFNTFGGLILAAHALPALIIGWFVGTITKKFGKNKTAIFSYMIGSLVLSSFMFFDSQTVLLGIVFLASAFIALSWPSISGAYADYMVEDKRYVKEIEGLGDFSTNIGFIIGPVFAGILADNLGNPQTFTALGVMGVLISLILLKLSPKEVKLHLEDRTLD